MNLRATIAELETARAHAVNPHEAEAATRILARLTERLRGYGTRTCARCGLTWRPKSPEPKTCGCCASPHWRDGVKPKALNEEACVGRQGTRYSARVSVDGAYKHLGCYATREEAIEARRRWLETHGLKAVRKGMAFDKDKTGGGA